MQQFRHVKIGNKFRFIDDSTVYVKIGLLTYKDEWGFQWERPDYLSMEIIHVNE